MKIVFGFVGIFILIWHISCSPTRTFTLEEPQEGKSLVIGTILVENDGIEDMYEAKTKDITVVLVGKSSEGEKERIKAYRLKTDSEGYFALPNVPAGAYVVKGIEVDLGYTTRLLITSRWEGNVQIYFPTEVFVDQTVRFWPPVSQEKIINMNIRYFRIDGSYRIYDDVFKRIENAMVSIPELKHTIPNPAEYYRQKYPEWGWFK